MDKSVSARQHAANWCVNTGGTVHEVVRGKIEHQNLKLDGKLFVDAQIRGCRVSVSTGNFGFAGRGEFNGNKIEVFGPARQVAMLLQIGTDPSIRRTGDTCELLGTQMAQRLAFDLERLNQDVLTHLGDSAISVKVATVLPGITISPELQ